MPKGVEHLQVKRASLSTARVTDSKMPKGVEHKPEMQRALFAHE